MNGEIKNDAKTIKQILSEWRGLWSIVDHEGKHFTKEQLYKLVALDKLVWHYQQAGLLVDSKKIPSKSISQKVKEGLNLILPSQYKFKILKLQRSP